MCRAVNVAEDLLARRHWVLIVFPLGDLFEQSAPTFITSNRRQHKYPLVMRVRLAGSGGFPASPSPRRLTSPGDTPADFAAAAPLRSAGLGHKSLISCRTSPGLGKRPVSNLE